MNAHDVHMKEERPPEDQTARLAVRGDAFSKDDTEGSISARFEKQVCLYPSGVAVKHRGVEITYEAFNRSANSIAQAIASECGGEAERVALLFEHDAAALAAMIGVLKSGRAYVPIDPSYPSSRVSYIMEDSQSDLLVTNGCFFALAEELASGRCKVINIDEISGVSEENPGILISANAMAYILYTSGSTGQPKGVVQTHRNLLHFIRSYSNSLGIGAADRLSLLPSFSFSASLMDIYGALLNGATLCPFNVKEKGTAKLAEWLIHEGITVYHSVPTLFRHLVSDREGENRFPHIKIIDLGGEPVSARDLELFRKHFSKRCVLVNHLAFTEASVVAQYFVGHETEVVGNNVPAGYAAAGVEILLLDDKGQGTEVGEMGEIAVKSDYLSPGYWMKPELTDAAFLRSPAGQGRIYRTGDMGRILPDGSLEHLGRKDFRVKIRGYSIEVAEVESALLKLGVIKEAVVAAKKDKAGDQLLVAYIMPERQPLPAVSEIRDLLKKSLPDYMVPSAFVVMDELPLTPSGKVDRRALPEADCSRPELGDGVVGPKDELERRLLQTWERVLGVRPIGVRDNFFDLGGHSLLAARLAEKIKGTAGRDISLTDFLRSPTVEKLAEFLRSGGLPNSGSLLVPLRAGSARPPIFWMHRGHQMARYLDAEQPSYWLRPEGADGRRALHGKVEDMAAHYLQEIMLLRSEGPYFLGGYCFGGIVALEMAKRLREEGKKVPLLFLVDPPIGWLRSLGTIARLRKPSPPHVENVRSPRNNTAISAMKKAVRRIEEWIITIGESARRRIKARIKRIRSRSKRMIKEVRQGTGMVISRIYLWSGRPVPVFLRKIYLMGINRRALEKYVLQAYPGKVIIFRSEKQFSGRQPDWSNIGSDIEIHKISGADHNSILLEPHIGSWAQQVDIYLGKTHANSPIKEK